MYSTIEKVQMLDAAGEALALNLWGQLGGIYEVGERLRILLESLPNTEPFEALPPVLLAELSLESQRVQGEVARLEQRLANALAHH